jgi:YVTN family beta-propeller protein
MLAFVLNPGTDSVSIFDTATNTVVKKVSVGVDSTVGVAITPDGKIAYVSDRGAASLSALKEGNSKSEQMSIRNQI